MCEGYSTEQASTDRDELIKALESAGINVTAAQKCGDYHEQGSGSFWVLELGKEANSNELYVSTLGKILSYVDVYRTSAEKPSGKSWTVGPKTENLEGETQVDEQNICKRVANQLGFLFPDPACLNEKVPSLNVYYFGDRKPMSVKNLLFYWQD